MRHKHIVPLLALLFLPFLLPAQEDAPAQDAESLYELDEVTGARMEKRVVDSPVVTEIISSEEIENSSAVTLTDVLDDYGLMYSSNAMGDYIQLQGMGESRVLFLVDGRRLVGRIAGRMNGQTLPLDNVERIEIVRGPQSALYGSDGIGGVVNIITKKPPEELAFSAGVTTKTILTYDDPATDNDPSAFSSPTPLREQLVSLRLGLPLGAARNSLSFEGGRGDFYYDEGERTSILPRYWRGKLALDSAFEPSDTLASRLGTSFMYLRSDQQTSPSGSLARSDYIRAEGSADFDWTPGEEFNIDFRIYDSFYQRDRAEYSAAGDAWRDTGQYENENLLSAEGLLAWYGLEGWVLSAGLEASLNTMRKFNLSDPVKQVDREAVFLQAERYGEELYSILGGLRVERNSQFGVAAAPKLSAMYRVTKAFRVLGGAGLGYRAPSFNDLYLVKDDPPHPLVLGTPGLRPEYALNANLGFDYNEKPFFLSANFYHTELFEEIAQLNTGRVERGMIVYETGNIARSFRSGADTEGRLSFLDYGYVSGGYSYLFAWDRKAGERLRPQPEHTVKFKLGLDTGSGDKEKAVTVAAWAGGRWFSALYPGEADSRSRLVLDAYMAVSLLPHYRVYFAFDNITGTIDQFLGPATPQSVSVGLHYTM
jgi:outer membrane receptor for ferrienterochelin and colicins